MEQFQLTSKVISLNPTWSDKKSDTFEGKIKLKYNIAGNANAAYQSDILVLIMMSLNK